ncbi:hypothetical protein TNCV_585851 [Trichonephila clavipes]|nr:hypothetical protein TNCV_585851 [Trichonephila clavipes]
MSNLNGTKLCMHVPYDTEWVSLGGSESQEGNSTPRARTKRENRVTVQLAFTVSDSTLSTIRHVTGVSVSAMTINK